MRIKKITLQNGYKRFKKTTIDLGENPKKIIALVGPNGSGKSSVFDGMLYLQNRYAQIGQFGQKGWQFHSMEQDPSFDSKWQENVQVEFDSGNFSVVHSTKNAAGIPKTTFVFRGPHRKCSDLNVTQLGQIPTIAENNIGASSTSDLDDKITQNYQRLFSLISKKNKTDEKKRGYEEIKDEVIGELNRILKQVVGISIVDHGDIIEGKGTLLFNKPDQTEPFDFNVLSSGEKEVVDILLDIYLKREVYNDSIYIIDEPELHINTGIQRKLLNALVELIPDTCQLWIATHSIGFLNALKQEHSGDSEIIWFEGNFSTDEITLIPLKKTRENWKKIFQTALEDLTGLLSPEKIVYCEGKKEPAEDGNEQGLDAEVYNTIFSEEYPDTLFVSSGGSTQPDQYGEIAIAILGKAFQGVELLTLRDMDINGNGSETTAEQRDTWLSGGKNRRMLNRKEIENYILEYDVVKKAYPTILQEDYIKLIPDISAPDVKKKVGDVMRLCGVVTGLNKSDFLLSLTRHISPEMSVYKNLKEVIFEYVHKK